MKIPLISLCPSSSSSNDISKRESFFKQWQFSEFSMVFHSSALLSYLLFHCENFSDSCTLVIHVAPQKKSTSKIFYVERHLFHVKRSCMTTVSQHLNICVPCFHMPALERHTLRCYLYECTFIAIKFLAVPYYHTYELCR